LHGGGLLDQHSGVSPAAPKRWLSEIVDTYDLEPGDIIYVDTGNYLLESPTVFGDLDGGDTFSLDPARQVTVQGSTNQFDGGTLFIVPEPDRNAIELDRAYGVRFRNLQILGGSNGLAINRSYFIAGDWLDIRGAYNGVFANQSSNIQFHHSAFVGNQQAGIRFYDAAKGSLRVGSSVMWSNRYGVYLVSGYGFVSNSILGMVSPGSFGYYMRSDLPETAFAGNYNNLYVGHASGAVGGYQAGDAGGARTTVYSSVSAWSSGTGQDLNSLPQDPLLADPGAGDFRLKSAGGRWQPGTGEVFDTVSSPLIDAGNPASMAWTVEPDPNGRRLNIGRYGGTTEASKTPVDGWLTLISLNDGGNAAGDVLLQWSVGGAATNYTVCIEYSPDDGNTWTNIVCGWPASTGSYLWDSVPYGRSALGRWRMFCLENMAIEAASLSRFVLRNGGTIPYYVNDAWSTNDVYCTAPGDDANHGLSPGLPKASLQAILDTYELTPEDVVFVDGGTYLAGSPPIKIDQRDSGWSNLYVTIQGSTNPVAPTVFQAPSFTTPHVFLLEYASHVKIRNLTIRNASIGVRLSKSDTIEFDRVRIENNRNGGIESVESDAIRLIRSILWKNATTASGSALILSQGSAAFDNCVLWGHVTGIQFESGSVTVSNSALDASGINGRIYMFSPGANPAVNFRGDYNSYTRRNGALIAERQIITGGSDFYNDLPNWGAVNGSDAHSMTLDPLFADEIQGDFHPKSTQGRWTPGGWTNDIVLSPLIDAGSPAAAAWTNEPPPNGGILNIGAYGGTTQASLTQTNNPWLRSVSYNDCGDSIAGNALLYWLHGGMASNEPVRLEYSTDYQYSWNVMASNLPAGSRQYLWDVSSLPLSLGVYWKVVSQNNTNIYDVSDCAIPYKPGNFDYYVNDSVTNNDVWCQGPGLPWDPFNPPGTNAATPINSLQALLAYYPVSGGDRIFIDTGTYPVSNADRIRFDDRNMGSAAKPLKIYGSTNRLAGGTLIQGNWSADGIWIRNTRYLELNDLRITQVPNGITLENVDTVKMRGMEFFQLTNAVNAIGCSDVAVSNSLFHRVAGIGYQSSGAKGAQVLLQNTFWGNAKGVASVAAGTLSVSNCILATTNTLPLYAEGGSALVTGDFNLFSIPAGGMIATNAKNKVSYTDLRQWQGGGRDWNSFIGDPLFVDPAATNFHLQSRAGSWSNGAWPPDSQTSWAIDAGAPNSLAYTNEVNPNGERVNLGVYGGTRRASLSDSSVPELLPISLRDGGIAQAQQPLYWLYRGLSPTNTLRIEYSPDNGESWVYIAGNVGIDSSPYAWYSDAEPTPEALWRIILDANTNIVGATTNPFVHRTRPLKYYVNDDSQDHDIYTGAIGSPANRGYQSNSPLHSIQAVLDRFQLSGDDEVRVDTGEYALTEPVFVSVLNSGQTNIPVKFIGSTNTGWGGSRLVPASGMQEPAFILFNARDVDISWFHMVGFTNALSLEDDSRRCNLRDLHIEGAVGPGVNLARVEDVRFHRVLIRAGATNAIQAANASFALLGCVLWSNQYSAIRMGSGVILEMTNSILGVSGVGNYGFFSVTNANLRGNYNVFHLTNGAQIASISGQQYARLPQWVRATAQERYSMTTDPLFHDPADGDFHLRSVQGRYAPFEPGAGWTNDWPDPDTNLQTRVRDFSRLIDMGAPQSAWSNEPDPNGARRNIGLHGNTDQASLSDTNLWIQAITFRGGGLAFGGITLTWGYGGDIDSNEVVRLEYSFDDGIANWVRIGESVAGARQFYWQSDLVQAGREIWQTSPAARWRIYLQNDPAVLDISDRFGLRNSPFKYYVNDSFTNNDVYATVPGDDNNLGFLVNSPKLTLQSLLEEVDLEPTDIVYIDTGVYMMNDTNRPILWQAANGGAPGEPVLVRGSTNAWGTWLVATQGFPMGGFFFMDSSDVDMRNVGFSGSPLRFTGQRLALSNIMVSNGLVRLLSDYSTFTDLKIDRGTVELSGLSNTMQRMIQRWGETLILGTNVIVQNSVVFTTNNMRTALVVNAVGAVVSNCTVVSTRGSALAKLGFGTLRAGHNILVAGGSHSNSVIEWLDGNLLSDWNNLWARDSAWVGAYNGKWERLAYWQAASGRDANSVAFDPLFQNERPATST
jgi:hypothetical protein